MVEIVELLLRYLNIERERERKTGRCRPDKKRAYESRTACAFARAPNRNGFSGAATSQAKIDGLGETNGQFGSSFASRSLDGLIGWSFGFGLSLL